MESSLQEIRREKVFVPSDMNIKDILEKYNVALTTARNSHPVNHQFRHCRNYIMN